MLHNRSGGISFNLELAFDMGWRELAVAIDIYQIDVVSRIAKKG